MNNAVAAEKGDGWKEVSVRVAQSGVWEKSHKENMESFVLGAGPIKKYAKDGNKELAATACAYDRRLPLSASTAHNRMRMRLAPVSFSIEESNDDFQGTLLQVSSGGAEL
jgi:hypothetical protein